MSIEKIVSGGQTGVDRAALDAAREQGIPIGGWCPQGRRAEDGQIDARYPLQETPSADYAQRTAWNVRDSDGTLILVEGEPKGGTALTVEEGQRRSKPLLQRDVHASAVGPVRAWIQRNDIDVLNVAGPRASEALGIYAAARTLITRLLEQEEAASD